MNLQLLPPFTTSETDICIGTAINFMAGTPPETVTSYIWDFGDFTNSTDQNPSHTYAEHGSYTVSLSYLDDFGCPAIVTQTIQVSDIETNLTKTDVNCFGNNNGSIEIEATGGIGAYQYSINNGVDYFDSGIFNNQELIM
jgi:PKD repeat protein